MSEPKFRVEQLALCAKRELTYRKRVYPRLIMEGRMDRLKATEEIAMMEAIARYFETKSQPELFHG